MEDALSALINLVYNRCRQVAPGPGSEDSTRTGGIPQRGDEGGLEDFWRIIGEKREERYGMADSQVG